MSQIDLFNTEEKQYKKVFLDEIHYVEFYNQVTEFKLNKTQFDILWNEHPREFHEVIMHGKITKIPRWQQAYGKYNEYTGSKNNALPISEIHQKYLNWTNQEIDPRLNGLLLNWYDGSENHYIGKHRDATNGLIKGSPIVTISHGEERVFRLRPFEGKGFKDFLVKDGDVLIIPWNTNKKYTHEVPNFTKYNRKRISVTLRAYS